LGHSLQTGESRGGNIEPCGEAWAGRDEDLNRLDYKKKERPHSVLKAKQAALDGIAGPKRAILPSLVKAWVSRGEKGGEEPRVFRRSNSEKGREGGKRSQVGKSKAQDMHTRKRFKKNQKKTNAADLQNSEFE